MQQDKTVDYTETIPSSFPRSTTLYRCVAFGWSLNRLLSCKNIGQQVQHTRRQYRRGRTVYVYILLARLPMASMETERCCWPCGFLSEGTEIANAIKEPSWKNPASLPVFFIKQKQLESTRNIEYSPSVVPRASKYCTHTSEMFRIVGTVNYRQQHAIFSGRSTLNGAVPTCIKGRVKSTKDMSWWAAPLRLIATPCNIGPFTCHLIRIRSDCLCMYFFYIESRVPSRKLSLCVLPPCANIKENKETRRQVSVKGVRE